MLFSIFTVQDTRYKWLILIFIEVILPVCVRKYDIDRCNFADCCLGCVVTYMSTCGHSQYSSRLLTENIKDAPQDLLLVALRTSVEVINIFGCKLQMMGITTLSATQKTFESTLKKKHLQSLQKLRQWSNLDNIWAYSYQFGLSCFFFTSLNWIFL